MPMKIVALNTYGKNGSKCLYESDGGSELL